ncbi:MAG: 3-deoxy-D-manno-octulosonic acid kinase [Wenzhouxiangella sp.]
MEQRAECGHASILYDSTLSAVPALSWLQPHYWSAQQALGPSLGGRGQAFLVQTACGPAALRRFLRGGWMAPLLGDRYLRRSADDSRGFREFRLLIELRRRDLPVPRPLAASFEPSGPFYRAGLLTAFIPGTRSLAELAPTLPRPGWQALADTLRSFFQAGLDHPDLNAHNLLCDQSGRWYLLDFDRALLRSGPAPAASMLARLERSLNKLKATAWREGFEATLR